MSSHFPQNEFRVICPNTATLIKPDFETTYTALRERLAGIGSLANKTLLGAKSRDTGLEIPFFSIPHWISRSGVTDMAGGEINPALGVVLCQYELQCHQDKPADDEELVTFREFEASGPLSGYFVENTQKLIAGQRCPVRKLRVGNNCLPWAS